MSKKKIVPPPTPEPVAPEPQVEEGPRRAIFALSKEGFMSLFHGEQHYRVVSDPLPPNAKIIDIRLESWTSTGSIEILIEHPSIPPIAPGDSIPYVKPPVFETLQSSETKPVPKKKK